MERDQSLRPARRRFLSAALVGLWPKSDHPIAGGFVDDAGKAGHRLRSRGPFHPRPATERVGVAIVGAGMAGLSAAWRLAKRGFHDFVVLEMEQQPGGVSRWGENEVSAYPWAAHYVPVPGPKLLLIRELLEDLGVLVNGEWNDRYLCFAPQERLYLHGRWQEGLEPAVGVPARDREQYRRFDERIREFRASGAFTIPIERAAQAAGALDRISMAEWMRRERFNSPYLNWYVNYGCRDDYGALASDTSAWAGVHYFAAREPEEKGPLVWPEGNGWIVRQLERRLKDRLRTGAMVFRITPDGSRMRALTESCEYRADCVIFAAPTFLAPYLIESAPPVSGFEYSPWLTANLTLDRLPQERAAPAWDNVVYNSPALGYVVATHQSLGRVKERDVWTFYWALASGPASRNRKLLLDTDWGYWKEAILKELARAHPDIHRCVSRIDVMRMGHAMVRPTVGFQSSEQRRRLAALDGPLLFAHSDLSGLSIIEEAQYRGVTAADKALARLGGRR